ncbi:hypothetical protein V6Z11_D11G112900 [Gossypium hirsutum]
MVSVLPSLPTRNRPTPSPSQHQQKQLAKSPPPSYWHLSPTPLSQISGLIVSIEPIPSGNLPPGFYPVEGCKLIRKEKKKKKESNTEAKARSQV